MSIMEEQSQVAKGLVDHTRLDITNVENVEPPYCR